MTSKLVAAHQPNFFPWLGYFNKIWRCDVFVILDDVQFEKSGRGSWVNRVRLANGGQSYWVTMPVSRDFVGTRDIAQMRIDDSQKWRAKLIRTLELHYRRAPAFSEVFPEVASWLRFETESVLEFNLSVIRKLMEMMALDTSKLVLSSCLPARGASTERIVTLTQAAGGTAYLSGRVAMETYQDPEVFVQAGVELVPQSYRPPEYPRGAEFVSGLSILDPLFWCGPDRTARLCADPNS